MTLIFPLSTPLIFLGVAVEELKKFKGQKQLRDECPPALEALLVKTGALDIYNAMVNQIFDDSSTRNWMGKWKSEEFNAIIDNFRDHFAEKGVRVAYCKRESGNGTFLWLEFIDVEGLESPYTPQYDLANLSGQVIKTMYNTLTFPDGVAVEELKNYGRARNKLKETAPPYVTELMELKGAQDEYQTLVEHVAEAGVGKKFKLWNVKKCMEIAEVHKEKFEAKGIKVYVCIKKEYVSHGQYGGHEEIFRWLEFVDMEKQPSYVPQRDASEDDCVVM